MNQVAVYVDRLSLENIRKDEVSTDTSNNVVKQPNHSLWTIYIIHTIRKALKNVNNRAELSG